MLRHANKIVCLILSVILFGGIVLVSNFEIAYGKEKKDDENDKLEVIVNINVKEIEKKGFLRILGYINGESFSQDVKLSDLGKDVGNIKAKFNVDMKTDIVTAGTPDEYFVCAYHIKDIFNEFDSLLYYDCNEHDIVNLDEPNKIGLFKKKNVFMKSVEFSEIYKKENNEREKSEIVKIKVLVPLKDRKDVEDIRIVSMVRGQMQTETINIEKELKESKDKIIERIFQFDRKTDIGNIQIGDKFYACVSGDELNPPEGTECEKRLIKKLNNPNILYAR
ncbi:MAG: hypothetical protein ACPKPY_12620 [Nitrososphaeraceae archaeon]